MTSELPASHRPAIGLLFCFAVAGLIGFGMTHSVLVYAQSEPRDIGNLVDEVFRSALHTEEIDVDGQKVIVRIPPSESTLRELRHQGDKAIPLIAAHLQSDEVDERILAVGLLGNQGGSQIVAPLRLALRDPESKVRLAAITSLDAAPRQLVIDILRGAAERDPDLRIREAAKKLLDPGPSHP